MIIREVRQEERQKFDKAAIHPLQSWEWGEFRKKTGIDVVRLALFEKDKLRESYQITFHSLPFVNWVIGYFPKGPRPNELLLEVLEELGRRKQAIFIKLEPKVRKRKGSGGEQGLEEILRQNGCVKGRTLFTPFNFQLDLTKSEEELLAKMKAKTRYNTRLAEKKGVKVVEDNSDEAFEIYWKLTEETAKRQGFYAHDKKYHQLMWETLRPVGMAHLFKAEYKGLTLVVWILFVFNGVLYYPYGASASMYRNVMASNLMMWEAIKFGKRRGCKLFDMWGSLGPEPNEKDPWYGFHRFKEGYGGELVEFAGSFDLVINRWLYRWYRLGEKWRWRFLKLKGKLRQWQA